MSARPWQLQPPAYDEIEAAALRVAGVCEATPVLESAALNALVGARVWIKAECLQRTGSFKLRGAYNRMLQFTPDERTRGVVAYSSGNHAQAVAAAAQLLGLHAVIVMPRDAPRAKLDGTRGLGAEVIEYDRYTEDRAALADRLVRERGLVLVPPYEDRRIIAGAGTLGREFALQLRERNVVLDSLLMGCSGGGLIAGCATAFAALSPATKLWAVEPLGFEDTAQSLASGERTVNDTAARSICDGLLVSTPGELSFEINRRLLAGGVAVSDAEVVEAMRVARELLQLTVEPGGVVALAAVLQGRIPLAGRNTGIVLTGGNVDADTYVSLTAGAAA
jgi:threonine dehydratase